MDAHGNIADREMLEYHSVYKEIHIFEARGEGARCPMSINYEVFKVFSHIWRRIGGSQNGKMLKCHSVYKGFYEYWHRAENVQTGNCLFGQRFKPESQESASQVEWKHTT